MRYVFVPHLIDEIPSYGMIPLPSRMLPRMLGIEPNKPSIPIGYGDNNWANTHRISKVPLSQIAPGFHNGSGWAFFLIGWDEFCPGCFYGRIILNQSDVKPEFLRMRFGDVWDYKDGESRIVCLADPLT